MNENSSGWKLAAFIVVVLAIWHWQRDEPAHWQGTPAPHAPEQIEIGRLDPFTMGEFTVEPLARYSVNAVVLSSKRYHSGRDAELAPVDLALGWGPMSVAANINQLDVSQGNRFYFYEWTGEPPIDPEVIATTSANTHCLPANPAVRDQLLDVERHDLVTLEGFLVEVTAKDGYRWRSSLTRKDIGNGACEVLWVTRVVRHRI